DFLDVPLAIGAADDRLGDVVLAYGRRGGLEERRRLHLGREVALERGVRPPLVRRPPRLFLVPGPADGHLSVAWLASSGVALERVDQLALRRGADEAVADLSREPRRRLAARA